MQLTLLGVGSATRQRHAYFKSLYSALTDSYRPCLSLELTCWATQALWVKIAGELIRFSRLTAL